MLQRCSLKRKKTLFAGKKKRKRRILSCLKKEIFKSMTEVSRKEESGNESQPKET
jgi:hypothetical protein